MEACRPGSPPRRACSPRPMPLASSAPPPALPRCRCRSRPCDGAGRGRSRQPLLPSTGQLAQHLCPSPACCCCPGPTHALPLAQAARQPSPAPSRPPPPRREGCPAGSCNSQQAHTCKQRLKASCQQGRLPGRAARAPPQAARVPPPSAAATQAGCLTARRGTGVQRAAGQHSGAASKAGARHCREAGRWQANSPRPAG